MGVHRQRNAVTEASVCLGASSWTIDAEYFACTANGGCSRDGFIRMRRHRSTEFSGPSSVLNATCAVSDKRRCIESRDVESNVQGKCMELILVPGKLAAKVECGPTMLSHWSAHCCMKPLNPPRFQLFFSQVSNSIPRCSEARHVARSAPISSGAASSNTFTELSFLHIPNHDLNRRTARPPP
jgi:hypothetical protein